MPTTSSGLRYPALTDSPNGPLQIGNLAADLDAKVLPAYATIAARNTAIPSPAQGRPATVAGVLHTYDGGAWRWRRTGFAGSVTTDASGLVSVNHNLGAAPTGVNLTLGPLATNALMNVADIKLSFTDTNLFTAFISRTDTNVALTGQLISFSWTAFV
jgi:hypothetical protein